MVNKQQRSALKQLDRPRFLVDADEIADMVGVLADVKTCAMISLLDLKPKRRRQLGLILDKLGLKTRIYNDKLLFVSKTEQKLDEYESAWQMHNNKDINEAAERVIGKLLGYPETSTDYYLKRIVGLETPDALPMIEPEIDGPEKYFNNYILSPDAYEAELDTYSRPLMKATKSLAPKSYAIIVNNQGRLGFIGLIINRMIIIGSYFKHAA